MKRTAHIFSLLTASATALVLAGLPATTADAALATSSPRIGDGCLVGTWHDKAGRTSTLWQGHRVPMRAGGGDIDHIAGNGIDHDNWRKSKPIVGHYAGHRLTERIRGVHKQRLTATGHGHSGTLTIVNRGWSAHSTNTYVYRGHHSTGYLNQSGSVTVRYRCNATTLRLIKKGKVVGTENRLSRKP
jgi:hypothetical protein